MIFKKRIYQVNWKNKTLKQLYQLGFSGDKIEKTKKEVDNILSQDPYGKVDKDSRVFSYHIKRLRYHLDGQWRLKFRENYWDIFNYRIIYEVNESEVLVEVFKFEDHENAYLEKADEDIL